MLQIISGKVFSGGKLNEQESDAILYSNYNWVGPITTRVAELRPISPYSSNVGAYVVRYVNRYEPFPNDPLVLQHGDTAVEQFRLLASFYFRAFFHADRTYVEGLCRDNPKHGSDAIIPNTFIPGYFELGRRGTYAESVGFVSFVS